MAACSPPDAIRLVRSNGGLFENSPSLHAEIRNRIEIGSVVIDEEFVTGFVLPGMPTEIHAAVVYHVADGLIQAAQLVG
jgi:hypothetical protein